MQVAGGDPPSYDPNMEARVARLEEDMREVKAVLLRLEPMIVRMDAIITTTLPQLSTKAELAAVRSELKQEIAEGRSESWQQITELRGELRAGLAEKPSKTYMWGVLTALITAYAAGLAALAMLR